MNEKDRQELERLKQQQIVLGTKLADLQTLYSELSTLRQKIGDLEERLKSEDEQEVKEPIAEAKAIEPVLEAPPVLETKCAEPKLYTGDWLKSAEKTELPAEPKKVVPAEVEKTTLAPELPLAQKQQEPPKLEEPNKEFEPFPVPPPVPPKSSKPVEKAPLELRVGTYWLVRIGIVMVLTALVFLANYAYKNWIMDMGPASKVGLLYFAGAVLMGVGGWLYHKFDALKNYAQVLVAGGLAEVYFTTYAAHHLHFLRVIQSPVLDAVLLLAWAGVIVAIADWKKAEIMALLAIVLSYYDAVITRVGMFTLYSNLILAVAALVFLVRNRWAATSLVSLIATYSGYAFWRFFGPHEGWHWASPEGGLWTGVWFLISYWVVFTAAGFLCREWPVSNAAGKGRAEARTGFLSLNNGAFFGLFVLTMLQVQQGGFWKVALIFGSVLIVLSILSRRLLPQELLTRNGYLTQGLFLVTLGFITKFTGPDLALVLSVESGLLLVMSRHLRNGVLRFGSVACAALSTTWAVLSLLDLPEFSKRGLIVGAVSGLFMIFDSWWAQRKPWNAATETLLAEKKKSDNPECVYFTILGLGIWALTTWRNTIPEWMGLTFAVESVLLLLASRWLPLIRFGSYAYAALGTASGLHYMADQYNHWQLVERMGLYPHAILGLLMIFNALWQQRFPLGKALEKQPKPDMLFSALALVIWLATTWVFTPSQWLAPALGLEALVFSLQLKWVRLPTLAVFGQAFLIIAQCQCAVLLTQAVPAIVGQAAAEATVPWWNPAIVIAITVGLSHWWKRNSQSPELGTIPVLGTAAPQLCQIVYAFATVGVLFFWLHIHFSPQVWLGFTCVLALALTVYGLATRLFWIAAFGQLFLAVSIFEFLRQVHGHAFAVPSTKLFALAPIVSLWGFSLAVLWWFARSKNSQHPIADKLQAVGLIYRLGAVLLAIGWIFEYVNTVNRFWVFALVGGLFFLWSLRRRGFEAFVISLLFTGLGFTQYFNAAPSAVYWPNLLCILALLVQQQLARRKFPAQNKSERVDITDRLEAIPESVHTMMILLGGCSLWLYAGQLVRLHSGGTGFFLTAVWAAVALVIFTTGFLLRERVYRWLGLGILAVALGRVVVVDVWELETPYRILSFMALGVVLLVLGFIYTKYQEKIRQWL